MYKRQALCSYSASADFDNFTIRKTAYPVSLPDIFTGAASAEHGSDYTFRAADAEHYVYGEVSAVMPERRSRSRSTATEAIPSET